MTGPAPARDPDEVVDLEVVEDRTAATRSDEGFLRVRRLVLRTVFADGRRSAPYPCDVVSRARVDAVAVALYEVGGAAGAGRTVRVLLKTGVRPPVWMRRRLALTQPDARRWDRLAEVVAGMLEPEDRGPDGIARRAAHEAEEEAGLALDPATVRPLGAESFPSPGITDEKVHFAAAEARLDRRARPTGDGSAMEEGGGVVLMPLRDAIEACRRGDVPDMKTEVALLRLCDAIGYVPTLDRFVDELPRDLAARWSPLGVAREPGR